ncbi:uncharacterized protein LOC128391575 [Panonychus citri]|uniref:uncharacterized protein LOC128391575 n=1 Tax=Panonychus citri TaxID=50023 RepID=UPI0023073B1E|nr:uncharacterized protein LOC128391575 [Panonychus citri]
MDPPKCSSEIKTSKGLVPKKLEPNFVNMGLTRGSIRTVPDYSRIPKKTARFLPLEPDRFILEIQFKNVNLFEFLKIPDYSESPGALKYRKKTCLRSYKQSDKAPDPNDYRKVGCEYLLKLRRLVGMKTRYGQPIGFFMYPEMFLSIDALENELGYTQSQLAGAKRCFKSDSYKLDCYLENTDEFVYHMKRAKFTPLLFSCVYCDWDSTDLSEVKKHLFGLKVGKKDKSFLVIDCKERMVKDGIEFPSNEVPIDHPPPRMFPWTLIKCVNPEMVRYKGEFDLTETIKAQWNLLMLDKRPKSHRLTK